MKRIINKIMARLGYERRRKREAVVHEDVSQLRNCLNFLSEFQDKINIVQIGANDGLLNDPLFPFVEECRGRTRLILVEPQEQLLPILEHNYRFHSEKFIFNGAVGHGDTLTLHAVKEDAWADLKVPYAQGWPAYRAPTGITSTHREHVVKWLSTFYQGDTPVQDIVHSFSVESLHLEPLIQRAGLFDRLDVLLVDTEGFDDEVIYCSDISKYKPRIIYFEVQHLTTEKLAELTKFLHRLHYIFLKVGANGLAILTPSESLATV